MKWPRVPRVRRPQLLDVVKIDGQYRVVVAIDSFDGVNTRPLADFLQRRLLVDRDYTLEDALIADGWQPPLRDIEDTPLPPVDPDLIVWGQ